MAISMLLVVPAGCGSQPDLPLQYRFEDDGDLDITVAGTTYKIESPYNIDVNGKKKQKKKKTTSAPRKSSPTKSGSRKQ